MAMKQRYPASHYVVLYGLTLIAVYTLAVALVFALDAEGVVSGLIGIGCGVLGIITITGTERRWKRG